VWRYVLRKDKWTKAPYQPRHPDCGAKADVPSTWATIEEAWTAYLRGEFDGIGYEFARDDPYFGVDVDHCLKDGQVLPWAAPILDMLRGTYGDISPSGNGVKFIGKGKLPADTGTNAKGFGPDGTGGLEMYDHGRFFTLTGNVFGAEPEVMP
jgi:putative DNA primase/helicase